MTATQINNSIGSLAYRNLVERENYQAEVIAKHYAAHAIIALELLKILESKHSGGMVQTDEVLILVDQIKKNHWNDFGIELEWLRGKEV